MITEIRPLQMEDVPCVIELCAGALPAETITPQRFARYVLLDPGYSCDGALVAKIGNTVAGFAYATARRTPVDAEDARRGFITLLAVGEPFRRRGVGRQLVAAAERSLGARGRAVVLVSPYGPSYFTPGVDVNAYSAGVSLFAALGYQEAYRPISMQVDLAQLAETEHAREKRRALDAAGAKVEAYRPELTRAILDFALAEFGVDWHDVYRDAMLQIVRAGERSERVLVVHRAGEVLGISHHDGERFGPIGVAKAERGRGVGQILMFETLRHQRNAGHRVAWFLWSDDNTARRLYDHAGFREVRRFAVMRKAL